LRKERTEPEIPLARDLLTLIRRHAALARAHAPDGSEGPDRAKIPPALRKMRGVVPRYARRLPGVRCLRSALARCESWEEFDAVLRDFFSAWEKEEKSAASL
jgi:hypothetical protein